MCGICPAPLQDTIDRGVSRGRRYYRSIRYRSDTGYACCRDAAEIGVILLLFTVGIEFSIAKLLRMKKVVVAGGGLQMILTTAFIVAAGVLAAVKPGDALFFGFLVALSSTAIVLKLLAEKGETDSPHGRVMVGILIFQDLCIVPPHAPYPGALR